MFVSFFSKDWLPETAVKDGRISFMTTVRVLAIIFHLAHSSHQTGSEDFDHFRKIELYLGMYW